MSDLMSMFGLSGKLVLVTGSTAGIGKAAARAFCVAGAKVIINGRKAEVVDAIVDELNKEGLAGKAVGVPGDLSTAEGVAAVVEKMDALGQLEVLVNNVGIFGVKDFFELTDDDWQHYYDVNVMSTVRMSRHFLKGMLERKTGRIVNVASEAGVRGYADMAQYAMTKAAQINLTRSLAGLTRGTGTYKVHHEHNGDSRCGYSFA